MMENCVLIENDSFLHKLYIIHTLVTGFGGTSNHFEVKEIQYCSFYKMHCWVFIFLLCMNFNKSLAKSDLDGVIELSNEDAIINEKNKILYKRQTDVGALNGIISRFPFKVDNYGKETETGDDALIFDDGDLNFGRPTFTRQVSFDDFFNTPNIEENMPPQIFSDEDIRGKSCEERCPSTQEYNPVCGDDNVTYQNIGKMQCANRCGKRVSLQFRGGCLTKARGK